MGKIIAVCTSDRKGIQKTNVYSANFLTGYGIDGDAHAGAWHRQVSLLSHDKVEAFRARGANVESGAFGENLVVEGIDFRSLPVGTLFRCGNVLLEMTQIGKECHAHCAIYHQVGDCIMPREGVFARVLEGGTICVGDDMVIEARKSPLPFQIGLIHYIDTEHTIKNNVIDQFRWDESSEIVEKLEIKSSSALAKQVIRLADQRQLDLILIIVDIQSDCLESLKTISTPVPSDIEQIFCGISLHLKVLCRNNTVILGSDTCSTFILDQINDLVPQLTRVLRD